MAFNDWGDKDRGTGDFHPIFTAHPVETNNKCE